jgi:hypothetical protein
MRRSPEQRQATEDRIRNVIDRLLGGDIPPSGRCDITTLARQTGVDRTAFYGTKPYAHLRAEFERKLAAHRQAGDHPDPRDAQIARLKTENQALRQRLTQSDQTLARLTGLNNQALSQIAAQHQEITRLRGALERAAGVRCLHTTTLR